MPRPVAPLLSREQIASAALDLIDETGTFTLPGLARRLGVSASSIYHHFPGGREAIIEAIRGHLTAGPAPATGTDWQTYAREWAREYRRAFARHPKVVPMLTAQTVSDPRTLATYEALARVLRDAGFHEEELLHAVTILDCFILGSALDAAAPLDVWAASDDPESALGAAIRTASPEPERRSERSFEIGLRVLLTGLADLRT
ncbi:TetR/AcrR family transcriptional regulator C-terminal domain-containing protein [Actinoplanes sichuanensis]|uniref:TetR/AcrR family transcriptional regulator n=1 Tax=Actinoplanes sichuanensis TaxID=512349 RepID=A0ABW4AAX5_9ACTN|nr:TetR/AcrR family transcriptional regulator [Actinoplanes sichuanensis]BEL08661.1 TetR/AcrR family transcriptional regulator C-terminal domain-containing protein [Actinoplanes sichuanensis]